MQHSYPYWVKFGGVYYPPNTPINDRVPAVGDESQEGDEESREPNRRRKERTAKYSEKED